MRYLKQFGIILMISFMGEIINKLVPLPVPASIYGLAIILTCLKTGIIKVDMIKETSKFLIEIMPFMFIPAAVGLLNTWQVLQPICVPVITITLISTVVVMAVTGRTTQFIIRNNAKKSGSKGEKAYE